MKILENVNMKKLREIGAKESPMVAGETLDDLLLDILESEVLVAVNGVGNPNGKIDAVAFEEESDFDAPEAREKFEEMAKRADFEVWAIPWYRIKEIRN